MSKLPNLPPIYTVRNRRVMLDSDLAKLYGATTMAFNQTIRRNRERFPGDFVFQVTPEELGRLKSQFVISKRTGRGGRRKLPWAFTEHGAIMAATVLRTSRAVAMAIYVVRAFVRLNEELLAHATLLKRLAEVEKQLITHDVLLRDVYEKLRPLLVPPPPLPEKEIGFHTALRTPDPRRGR